MEKSNLKKFEKDQWLLSKKQHQNIIGGLSKCATSCQDDGNGGICCEDTSIDWN